MRFIDAFNGRFWPEAAAQVLKWRTTACDPQETFVTQVLRLVEHHINDALDQRPADHRADGY